jgi:hypothetical protein
MYPVESPSELGKIKELKQKLTDVVVTKACVPQQWRQFVGTNFHHPIELINLL